MAAYAFRGLPFTPVDPQSIPAKGNGKTGSRYLLTVREFVVSGAVAVEVDPQQTDPRSVTGQLTKAIDRAGLSEQLCAFQRRGRVFLVRRGAS